MSQLNFVSLVPFLNGLPEDTVRRAIDKANLRDYPPKQLILRENDWGGSVYFVLEGWVKICTYNTDGREIALNIAGKGEIVGEMAALEDAPHSSDVLSLTAVTMANIPTLDFINLIQSEALAGMQLAKLISQRLRQVNHRLIIRESNSTSRLADTLLFLAEKQGKIKGIGAEIMNLSHQDLASFSGLTRQTVTRIINQMSAIGLITRTRDLILIPDLLLLKNII
jgi:CRP/FNR family transcriptional regulator, cyclic AMP receptor protein